MNDATWNFYLCVANLKTVKDKNQSYFNYSKKVMLVQYTGLTVFQLGIFQGSFSKEGESEYGMDQVPRSFSHRTHLQIKQDKPDQGPQI